MVLGTVVDRGRPWSSTVYYAPERYLHFYWLSRQDALLSRTAELRGSIDHPDLMICHMSGAHEPLDIAMALKLMTTDNPNLNTLMWHHNVPEPTSGTTVADVQSALSTMGVNIPITNQVRRLPGTCPVLAFVMLACGQRGQRAAPPASPRSSSDASTSASPRSPTGQKRQTATVRGAPARCRSRT